MSKFKTFILVLFENALCLMFFSMLFDLKHWSIVLTTLIGLFWLVSFSICVIGRTETKELAPSGIAVLGTPTELTKYEESDAVIKLVSIHEAGHAVLVNPFSNDGK